MFGNICVIFLICPFLFEATKESLRPGNISVSIIADKKPKDDLRHHTLGVANAVNFIKKVFRVTKDNPVIQRKIWPSVITSPCPGTGKFIDITAYNKPHAEGFQRGTLLAHRQVWDDFARRYRNVSSNISVYESPKIVIFEGDVMEIDIRAHDIAYQSVLNMTSNIHYLGTCFDNKPGFMPPLCLHAYVLTVKGARTLLGNMDWCVNEMGGDIDTQVQLLGYNNITTWSSVPPKKPFGLRSREIHRKSVSEGFTIQWGGSAGGLFYQVEYDEPVDMVDGKAYMPTRRPNNHYYLFKNNTAHKFKNITKFEELGFKHTDVTYVPLWQLRRIEGHTIL